MKLDVMPIKVQGCASISQCSGCDSESVECHGAKVLFIRLLKPARLVVVLYDLMHRILLQAVSKQAFRLTAWGAVWEISHACQYPKGSMQLLGIYIGLKVMIW